jgi:hypothetical protein
MRVQSGRRRSSNGNWVSTAEASPTSVEVMGYLLPWQWR